MYHNVLQIEYVCGILLLREVEIVSPKNALTIRINEDIEKEIEEFTMFFEQKTGVPTTKTAIIESALREGIKVLRSKLEVND
jgi:hypothetical protein